MGVKQLISKSTEAISEEDKELLEIIEKNKTKIKVVGCGGAGNNTITRLMQEGIVGAETIAINTDAMDLLYTDAHKKVLIGKETTQGLGAGSDPDLGMKAAEENKNEIKNALKGANMVFLTAGLGGGCLRGSSLVYTNPEGPVRIDSIKPGTFVYSFENGKLVKRRVIAAMKTGVKRVFEVKTKDRAIVASYDHPFLKVIPKNASSSNEFYEFDLQWTPAESLKRGDLVVVLKRSVENEIVSNKSKKDLDSKEESLYGYVGPKDLEFFKYFGFSKIESVKELGEEEVFDITVEGSHNFVAEGFVVHNTGTGSIPVVAKVAKELGALTVAIVTLPFKMEGRHRMLNARKGLENLEGNVDTLIVIPNEKLLEIVPDASLEAAFKFSDEILVNAVKGTIELVTKPGLVNLDFADLKAVMKNGGFAVIGVGESDSDKRAIEAVEKAINNPLIEADISKARGALINVVGGPNLTMREYYQAVNAVSSQLPEDAKIIAGAKIEKEMEDMLRVLLIITGVRSPYIFDKAKKLRGRKKKNIENVLGVDFVE